MTERGAVLTGGCQCGGVRYALFSHPESSLCHCRMCQKAVGGPFAALGKVPKPDLAWTRGQPAAFRSSSAAERGFCAACGTPLTFQYLDGEGIEITLGSLDHPERAPPTKIFGAEGRVAWIPAALEGALPERTTEQLGRKVESYQHPDHETEASWRPHGVHIV